MIRVIREEEPSKPSTRLSIDAVAAVDGRAAADRTAQVDDNATGRARLGGDEMPGEGARPTVRDGERPGPRRPALPGGRDRRGTASECRVSAPQVRRRHKGQVVAASLVLLSLVLGIVGTTWGLIRAAQANTALAAANSDLTVANAKVHARYELAVDAVKTFHTGVSEDFLLKQNQFKELRDRLLKSAADFYGKLSALLGNETDLASRRALAAANFELADLTDKVGRKEEALAAHRAVLAARKALAAGPEANAEASAMSVAA